MNSKNKALIKSDKSPNKIPKAAGNCGMSPVGSRSDDQATRSSAETKLQHQDTVFHAVDTPFNSPVEESISKPIFNPRIDSNQADLEQCSRAGTKRKVESTMDVYLHANGCIEIIKKEAKSESPDEGDAPSNQGHMMDCSSSDDESLPQLDSTSVNDMMNCETPRRTLPMPHHRQGQQEPEWVLLPPQELYARQEPYPWVIENAEDGGGNDDSNVRVVSPSGHEEAHPSDEVAYKTPKL